ncbi:MAG TPA: POTRA domain-containing protein, partial [Pseudoxanthomonas sp.]|nr:POTRA domain-containing protein [Pseudoxanthomonas sp.]
MRPVLRLAPAALLIFACPSWAAAIIDKVQVKGLDPKDETQALMIENIELALSLSDSLGKRVGESRLEYLLTEAVPEASEALEPFGYYAAEITVEAPRPNRVQEETPADAPAPEAPDTAAPRPQRPADHLTVTVHVKLGEPVRVRNSHIAIEGEGGGDKYLKEDLQEFHPQPGEIFDHTTYEASKTKIVRRLAERGYFDADFTNRKVEVTRADRTADIDLGWVSGIRYDMGPTRFHQSYFKPGLLERLVYWEEGSYFHQGKLDRLRQSLVGLDYFGSIDIQPNIDEAVDGRVPTDVNLELAKRDVYTFGVSYGTESGPGIRAGLDRRYVNRRGHKASIALDYAQKRKSLTTLYRIPAFKWLDGWYGIAFQAYDEQTDYIDTRRIELIGSRSGQLSDKWTAIASVHALRERWRYDQTLPDFNYSTLLYPEISGQYSGVDDRAFPRRGFSGNVSLRAGAGGAGSDTSFAQLHVIARW